MTFLPIVGRELRVASRKRSTFWARIAAALVALVLGIGFLVLAMTWGSGLGAASCGRGLFATLTWLSLAVALSAGLFFTADCLSEEKREGTIGFLFLTDLSGYDVVLGKLLATSLRGSSALLAVVPILAVTLLMGGVTGAEFWRTELALGNALFLSLAAGLFVSAISRDSQKSLAATLFLVVLLAAGGPAGDAIIAAVQQRGFSPALSLSSPAYVFVAAGAWGKSPFWPGLLLNLALGALLLGLTCVMLPRTWQERTAAFSTDRGGWAQWWKFGGSRRRAALRRKFLGANPVLWLACRERWQSLWLWAVALLMAGVNVALFAAEKRSMLWTAWSYLGSALSLVFYLAIASHAGRFYVEVRRSGLIETLLATPLTVNQIVQGQWRALLRTFGPPLALWLAAQLLSTIMVQQANWSRIATTAPAPTASTISPGTNSAAVAVTNPATVITTGPATVAVTTASLGGMAAPNGFLTLATSIAGTLTAAANLAALGWFGMWMGLTSKNLSLATLKTIVFVEVIPWFGVSFVSMLVIPLLLVPRLLRGFSSSPSANTTLVWYTLIIPGLMLVLFLVKDVVFVLWSRRKLYSEFRERATRPMAPIALSLPPPLPRAAAPPVITVP